MNYIFNAKGTCVWVLLHGYIMLYKTYIIIATNGSVQYLVILKKYVRILDIFMKKNPENLVFLWQKLATVYLHHSLAPFCTNKKHGTV